MDDRASGGASNVNGVLEAGERVTLDPGLAQLGAGHRHAAAHRVCLEPHGATGTDVHAGGFHCGLRNDCIRTHERLLRRHRQLLRMTVSGTRPAVHWDATFDEALSSPDFAQPMTKTWALHVGGSFPDVPQDAFYPFIESIFHNGVTGGGGCGVGQYCGDEPVLRQQMAVLLLKSAYGAAFTPPAATGAVFDDVAASHPFAAWIEELAPSASRRVARPPLRPYSRPIVPASSVNRQQMAVFLYKIKWGPFGVPGQCDDIFDDVPCSSPFAPYIEYQFQSGIAAGCQTNPPLYCPTDATKRKQMAPFLVKTFGLELYGRTDSHFSQRGLLAFFAARV